MKVGDYFKLDGYTEMARASTNFGSVCIHSNNSSCMLVSVVTDEAMSDGEGEHGQLKAVFAYKDDVVEWEHAYRLSLLKLLELVSRGIR